jgi:putative chitinase
MAAIPPTKNHELLIDEFIRYAQQHLTTVSGIVNTVSSYPPANTPGPGVANWQGYNVEPPNPSVVEVSTEEIEMTDAELLASEEATLEGADINEATAAAFDEEAVVEPTTPEEEETVAVQLEEVEEKLKEDAANEPDPPLKEEEKPKNDIKQEPNFKSKLKVPNELVLAMRKYGVGKTPLERAHFLAQTNHESGNFIYKEEIASGKAYEGRKDLGNTQVGDGPRYKGRGYIQLTGRANYRKFGPVAGADFENSPTIVATKYFADTACLFWKANKLGAKCVDSSTTTIKVVTKRINGGYNGLDDRIKKFTLYWTDLQKDNTLWA